MQRFRIRNQKCGADPQAPRGPAPLVCKGRERSAPRCRAGFWPASLWLPKFRYAARARPRPVSARPSPSTGTDRGATVCRYPAIPPDTHRTARRGCSGIPCQIPVRPRRGRNMRIAEYSLVADSALPDMKALHPVDAGFGASLRKRQISRRGFGPCNPSPRRGARSQPAGRNSLQSHVCNKNRNAKAARRPAPRGHGAA